MVVARTLATVIGHGGSSRRVRIATATGAAAAVAAAAIIVGLVEAPGGRASGAATASASITPTQMTIPSNPHTTDPNFFPPSNGPGVVAITQANAVSSARAQAVSATGDPLSAEEQAALPTYSRLMAYSDAVQLTDDGADPRIDPNRQVWVVSVLGHHPVDTAPGSKANPITDKYTIVTDATSGFMILGVFGVASLTS